MYDGDDDVADEVVTNHLQRCVTLGWSGIWTPDLPHTRHAPGF